MTKIKADLIYKPRGCAKCNQLGYRGRTCITEVLPATDAIRSLVNERAPFQKIKEVARSEGMQTLYESAIKKVEAGITSLEEAISITIGGGE